MESELTMEMLRQAKRKVDQLVAAQHNEIRADFAQRLKRRFEAMASEEARRTRQNLEPFDCLVWQKATRVVDLLLAECNEEEEQ